MKLPMKVKGFNLFFEGLNLHGLVVDVTRPKISFKTEAYRPGGFDVDVQIEQGLESLELEFTAGGYTAEVIREMGGSVAGKVIRYQGSLESEDESEFGELVGEARGRITEVDYGTDKQGDDTEVKFKMQLVYWRETLNGKPILEIDALGGKLQIGDKDLRADRRRRLGL
ncbi:phage major tail tube protein [Neisseria sp. S1]|uniref:phage major tail tube protein n=1 Tax=Neisseria sp. S1 TaxID=3318354 RepID=UPI003A8B29AB